MNDDRRNPYLVLGLPYGSSRNEATKAFARRTRLARRTESYPYTVDDLTWALNEVEAQLTNPASDVDTFRVPADPEVLRPPAGPGLLRLRPVPLKRRTEPSTEADLALLEDMAMQEALLDFATLATARAADTYGRGLAPLTLRVAGEPRTGHSQRWIVGLVILALLAAGVVAAVLSSSSSSTAPSTTAAPPKTTASTAPSVVDVGPISTLAPDGYDSSQWTTVEGMETLAQGRCFDFVEVASDGAGVQVKGCEGAHRYQVFSVFDVPADVVTYDQATTFFNDACLWNFSAFVGLPFQESYFEIDYIRPSADQWPATRTVHCLLFLDGERKWIGSAEANKY